MINHKYNISDSDEEIISVSESLPAELVQLPETITLNSNYRVMIPGGSHHQVTVRSSHDQSNSETTASATANKPVLVAPTAGNNIALTGGLRTPHVVASKKDDKAKAKHPK